MLCRDYYNFLPIRDEDALCEILCYPECSAGCFSRRIEDLRMLGIDDLYSFGKLSISRDVRIVGKGHAAVVVLAHHYVYGAVALKIRRIDSKKFSIEWEAKIIGRALTAGFVPKVYGSTRDFLVREYIDGPTLRELFIDIRDDRSELLKAVESLLKAALAMDTVRIDLDEISRPLDQVVYLCGDTSRPFFIDLESAKISSRPSNVTKVLSFIINGAVNGDRVRDLLGIDIDKLRKLVDLARIYKTENEQGRRDVFNDLLTIIMH